MEKGTHGLLLSRGIQLAGGGTVATQPAPYMWYQLGNAGPWRAESKLTPPARGILGAVCSLGVSMTSHVSVFFTHILPHLLCLMTIFKFYFLGKFKLYNAVLSMRVIFYFDPLILFIYNWSLYPFTNLFLYPPFPNSWQQFSTLCFYEFNVFYLRS